MAATEALTLAQVSAAFQDNAMTDYVNAMAPLPDGVGVEEFLAKFTQASYIAQEQKNRANTDAQDGELLSSFSPPQTTAPTVDTESGIQTYTSTHSVSVVAVVGLDTSVPVYS